LRIFLEVVDANYSVRAAVLTISLRKTKIRSSELYLSGIAAGALPANAPFPKTKPGSRSRPA